MDILLFMKDEYSAIRGRVSRFVGTDDAYLMEGAELCEFVDSIDLVARITSELIVPEVIDSGSAGTAPAILAEDQAKSIGRVVHGFRRSKELLALKRLELFKKIEVHLEHMEKILLPLFREKIPTAIREDLGDIAQDMKVELASTAIKAGSSNRAASISA